MKRNLSIDDVINEECKDKEFKKEFDNESALLENAVVLMEAMGKHV